MCNNLFVHNECYLIDFYVRLSNLIFSSMASLLCFMQSSQWVQHHTKVKFWNSCISEIVGLIEVNQKGQESNRYLVDYMTVFFEPTHDFDLEVSRSKFKIATSQKWKGQLTWYKRDVSHPCMIMTLTFVWPWWGGWMYLIVTGVTSDIGMTLTYLVYPYCLLLSQWVSSRICQWCWSKSKKSKSKKTLFQVGTVKQ